MKNTEFRIGNLIEAQLPDGPYFICRVNADLLQTLTKHPDVSEYYVPIEITEEWLLKLGFNKDEKWKGLYYIGELGMWWYSDRKTTMLHQCKPNNVNFKYVHELQNLYFGLTKTELPCVGF